MHKAVTKTDPNSFQLFHINEQDSKISHFIILLLIRENAIRKTPDIITPQTPSHMTAFET